MQSYVWTLPAAVMHVSELFMSVSVKFFLFDGKSRSALLAHWIEAGVLKAEG